MEVHLEAWASSCQVAPSCQGEVVHPSSQVEEVPCQVAFQVVPCLEALASLVAWASSCQVAYQAASQVPYPWVASWEVLPDSEEEEWRFLDIFPVFPS